MIVRRRAWLSDLLLSTFLVAVNLAVCWRLFKVEYTGHFYSIEGAFIAIARYITRHWGDLSWWPLWHCGMPFHDTYVPLLHLVVAGVAAAGHISAARAYHSVIGAAYALGPAALYFMALRLGTSRGAAFLAALFYSLLSPSALLMPDFARDIGGIWYARRLQVLAVYGEGPHVSAMTLHPIAILALQNLLVRRTARALAFAAVAIAAIFLTNIPGTMALGVMVFCWICAQPAKQWRMAWTVAVAASVMAYALACYGVPPSSFRTVVTNVDATHPGFTNSLQFGPLPQVLVLGIVAAAGWLLSRRVQSLPVRFALLYFPLLAGMSLTADFQKFELLPQVGRLHLEMEMGACLLLGLIAWRLYNAGPRWTRLTLAAVALVAVVLQIRHYRASARGFTQPADLSMRSEYTTARWLDANIGGQRVYVTGSTSFWLNAFTDTPQVIGCCDQGYSIGLLRDAAFHINAAVSPAETEESIAWLRALGAAAIVVNGPTSTDEYKDIHIPERFERILPALHRENGDTVLSLQQGEPSLAHVLRADEAVPVPGQSRDVMRYAAAIGDSSRAAARLEWLSSSAARIRTQSHRGELISVQVTWSTGWRALVSGAPRSVRADGLGFILIDPQCEGDCEISLNWTGLPDSTWSAAITAVALLLVVAAITVNYRF